MSLILWRLCCCTEPALEPEIDAGDLSVCLCSVSAILCPDEAGQLSSKARHVTQVGEVMTCLLGHTAL